VSDPAPTTTEYVTEDLVVSTGKLTVPTDPQAPAVEDVVRLRFALHRHPLTEGPDGLVMWSMPRATVYRTRGRVAENFLPILYYYWLKQKVSLRDTERDARDT
jgi:hypothetical protein